MTAAVVLAAGRGSRLGRHTRHLPKALVRVGGRSLLDWQLSALRAAGLSPIVVVGGYLGERLARERVELVHAPRWPSSGPLESLRAARPERFGDGFVLAYADCPHHPANLHALLGVAGDVAVAGDRLWHRLWSERHGDPLVDAESYRGVDGRLLDIGRTPRSIDDVQAQFAGLVRFSAMGWTHASMVQGGIEDITGLLGALLNAGIAIADVPIRGRWSEIDSAIDLQLCRRRLHGGERWSHDWRMTAGRARWA